MRIGFELPYARIEVRDATGSRKLREQVVLEVGNLRAGVEEHSVVVAADSSGDNGDSHDLLQGDDGATQPELVGGNNQSAAGSVEDMVEAAKNVCAEQADTSHADKLGQGLDSEA